MIRKSPNLNVRLPLCRKCKRYWRPPEGVVSSAAYCNRCAKSRREAAEAHFALKPITKLDLQGPYLLPRRFRAS